MSVEISGLTSQEAGRRLAEFGPNEVTEPEVSLLKRIGLHFWEPVPWMLEAAIVLQMAIGERIESGVIAALLVFNVILSFFQEGRAHAALAALKSKLAVKATVKRDGVWREVSAVELALGDVIKLELGSVVPADARIAEGSVLLDQSMLTGESTPVEIGGGDLAYAGAMARRGAAVAEVVATGARTYFGKTAELVSLAHVRSGEQDAVLGVVRNLAVFNGAVIVLLIAYAHQLAMPAGHIIALVLTAVLASIPVALPATFTLAAALGAQALTKKGVLLTRLSAVHEAATVDVLCVDKTGTLTRNELKVVAVKSMRAEFSEGEVLALAALASATAGFDPVDEAIRAAVHTADSTSPQLRVERFTPFDPATKIAEAVVCDEEGRERRIIKGAPAAVSRVTLFDAHVGDEIEILSRAGSRVLAVAYGPLQHEVLVGMIGLSDPPRPESKALIAELRSIGVSTVMITGDAEATAVSVARSVGIEGTVCSAEKIPVDVGPEDFSVYAGVFPEDKFRLVKAFQRKGHTVGMCGDGANDAPALRQAQMGVAVSTATDVAKSAASIVLTEPGLRGVVTAIEEGRVAFQRILTYTLNALVKKFQLVPFLGAGLLITGHAIMTPMQMALLLITGDFLTMSIATDRATPSSTPDSWRLRAITGAAAALGLFGLAFLVGVIVVGKRFLNLTMEELRTLTFVALVFSSQATVYVVRDRKHMWCSSPSAWLVGSSILNVAIAVVLALTGLLMAPLPAWLIASTFFATLFFSIFLDGAKSFIFKAFGIVQSRKPVENVVAPRSQDIQQGALRDISQRPGAWVVPAGAVALLAFAVLGWRYWSSLSLEPSHYVTQTAERGSVVRSLTVKGVVEAPPLEPIMARTSGTILSLACDVGTRVEVGQVCAKIESRPQQILMERESAKLAAAERRLARGRRISGAQQARLARGDGQARRRLLSQHERTLAELTRDEDETDRIRRALDAARKDLVPTEVRAPIEGIVVTRHVAIGQKVVANDAASPLFLLAKDSRDAIVALDVPRNDLKVLRPLSPVVLMFGSTPDRTLAGEIAQIARPTSEAEEQAEHRDVLVKAPNRDGRLSVGTRVTGKIEVDRRDNVLRAPIAALRFAPGPAASAAQKAEAGSQLWVLRNGALTQVPIKAGLDDGEYVEIVDGILKEGDQIVVGERGKTSQ